MLGNGLQAGSLQDMGREIAEYTKQPSREMTSFRAPVPQTLVAPTLDFNNTSQAGLFWYLTISSFIYPKPGKEMTVPTSPVLENFLDKTD